MVRNTDVQEHNIIVQYTVDFDIYTFVERARGFGVPRVIQLIIYLNIKGEVSTYTDIMFTIFSRTLGLYYRRGCLSHCGLQ